MVHSELALQTIPPGVSAHFGGHPQTRVISPDQENLHNPIPDCLLKYGPKQAWNFTSVEEISQQKTYPFVKNLYIPEILLKKHEPNVIFEKISALLSDESFFAFKIITAENIKLRIQHNYPRIVFRIYYLFHFLIRRVLPKLKGFRKICRLLAIPVDVSKAEIMGRLIYKGFAIVDLIETAYETIVITQLDRDANPSLSKPASDEGFLFKMQRVGNHGKHITVYKFRSMHPYAEYVQAYLHQTNGLDQGGKFKNDFRVSTGGRVLRKYWIDELPMVYNLLKGDIKLIGVRPISEHYLSLYPADVQTIRRNYKPGLLPPFYADMPQTFSEIVASELAYLNQYERAPLQTDLAYLKRILSNIIIRRVRSK